MSQEKLEALLGKIESYKLPLILGLLGIIFVGLGLLLPKLQSAKKQEISIQSTNADKTTKLKVDVSGAVKTPGVYDLGLGSRVLDAIYAAGGFSNEADSTWVAKQLNLAAKVVDGQKVFINSITPSQPGVLGENTSANQDLININSASRSELDTLPGVGEVTADKIISSRPYSDINELLTKKIVGKATFEKIKAQISVY